MRDAFQTDVALGASRVYLRNAGPISHYSESFRADWIKTCRVESARDLVSVGFDGYAVGGLSVGKTRPTCMPCWTSPSPAGCHRTKPRYLMGVGMPEDLVEGVARGIDMFDCVVPSRHGRTGWLFTSFGRVVIKQARARDEQPIDPACTCPGVHAIREPTFTICSGSKEMLGLASIRFIICGFAKLMERSSAVRGGTFQAFRREFHRTYVVDRPTGDSGRISEYERVLTASKRGQVMWDSVAWAQGTSGSAGAGGLLSLVPFVLIFVIFYFMLILPQQKRRKQADAMLRAEERRQGGHGFGHLGHDLTNMEKRP